jgi:hypothetical protein
LTLGENIGIFAVMGSRLEREGKHHNGDPSTLEVDPQESERGQRINALVAFLNGDPINFITVNSVLPDSNFGLMYSVTIGRYIGEDEVGNKMARVCNVSNYDLLTLKAGLSLMGKKKRRQYQTAVSNIRMITKIATNPVYWRGIIDGSLIH